MIQYPRDTLAESYVQIFRNGIVESVDMLPLTPNGEGANLAIEVFETRILRGLETYVGLSHDLEIPLPFVILIAVNGVLGCGLHSQSPIMGYTPLQRIDRDLLLLPEVLVEDYESPVDALIRPIFDSMWQAFGLYNSHNYNQEGRWDGGKSNMPGHRG